MNWHLFSMYGMGGHTTDPGEDYFVADVKATIPNINCHNSPYNDRQCYDLAAFIDKLPATDGIFVAGTSLGCNNTAITCGATKHIIQGAFGFQASLYGAHSSLTKNVLFAHLIYSYNPIPFPGLGAYLWKVGTMNPPNYHRTPHHIPHPGDYDVGDRQMFIREMKHIIAKPGVPS